MRQLVFGVVLVLSVCQSGGAMTMWNLDSDFALVLPQVGQGQDNVWWFSRALPGDRDGIYPLLTQSSALNGGSYAHLINPFHLAGPNGWVHPGGFNSPPDSVETDVIVEFRAPRDGTYHIFGTVEDIDDGDSGSSSSSGGVWATVSTTPTPGVPNSDGNFYSVILNAAQLAGPEAFDITTNLVAGQTVYFRVNDRGLNHFDTTDWNITITPEPASLALVLIGAAALVRRRP